MLIRFDLGMQGSTYLYRNYLSPLFTSHERDVDALLGDLRFIASGWIQRAITYVWNQARDKLNVSTDPAFAQPTRARCRFDMRLTPPISLSHISSRPSFQPPPHRPPPNPSTQTRRSSLPTPLQTTRHLTRSLPRFTPPTLPPPSRPPLSPRILSTSSLTPTPSTTPLLLSPSTLLLLSPPDRPTSPLRLPTQADEPSLPPAAPPPSKPTNLPHLHRPRASRPARTSTLLADLCPRPRSDLDAPSSKPNSLRSPPLRAASGRTTTGLARGGVLGRPVVDWDRVHTSRSGGMRLERTSMARAAWREWAPLEAVGVGLAGGEATEGRRRGMRRLELEAGRKGIE